MSDGMTYGDYLKLDRLLSAQAPQSDAHDEMLFIIQHQTTELWMRLLLHEIGAARDLIAGDDFAPAFKMLARVSRIFDQLNLAWDVLRTMTPRDYGTFRDALGGSSGFQSHQYRLVEYALGNRNTAMVRVHEGNEAAHRALTEELARPSLYAVAVGALGRATGESLPAPADGQGEPDERIEAAWTTVYRTPERYWDMYELAEKLVDLEDYFRRWRFNHVTTVERVIGMKPGTGGTSGVAYLRKMLDVVLFPELWRLRGNLT